MNSADKPFTTNPMIMENILKKGLILGGLLAAGIAGYALHSKRPQLAEELKEHYNTIMKIIKKSLHKLKDVSKEDFLQLVSDVVSDYTEKKKLGMNAKESLIAAIKVQRDDLEAEYLEDKDE